MAIVILTFWLFARPWPQPNKRASSTSKRGTQPLPGFIRKRQRVSISKWIERPALAAAMCSRVFKPKDRGGPGYLRDRLHRRNKTPAQLKKPKGHSRGWPFAVWEKKLYGQSWIRFDSIGFTDCISQWDRDTLGPRDAPLIVDVGMET